MGGSIVPGLSSLQYALAGIVIRTPEDLHLRDESPEEHALHSAGKARSQRRLYMFLRGTFWTILMLFVVITDFILTLVVSFVAGVKSENLPVAILSKTLLGTFCLDIVLRLIASDIRFFNGPDRHMNIMEFMITVVCVILEVAESSF